MTGGVSRRLLHKRMVFLNSGLRGVISTRLDRSAAKGRIDEVALGWLAFQFVVDLRALTRPVFARWSWALLLISGLGLVVRGS
jgi:hypothetical protein